MYQTVFVNGGLYLYKREADEEGENQCNYYAGIMDLHKWTHVPNQGVVLRLDIDTKIVRP